MSGAWVLGALALLASPKAVAHSVDEAELLRSVTYHAPADCPEAREFARRVRERSGGDRRGGAQTRLDVVIRAEPLGYIGKLRFSTSTTALGERALVAATCDALVTALAVVTAVALDGDAMADTPRAAVVDHGPTEVTRPAPTRRLRVAFGIAPSVLVGLAPRAVGAGTVFGEIALARWAVRFGVTYARSPRIAATGSPPAGAGAGGGEAGGARYELAIARVDGCREIPVIAWGWRGGSTIAFVPCALIEWGALHASGAWIAIPESATQTFAATGGELGIRLGGVSPFWLELGLSGRAPLKRAAFYFDAPFRTVSEVSPVVWGLGVSVGVPIP